MDELSLMLELKRRPDGTLLLDADQSAKLIRAIKAAAELIARQQRILSAFAGMSGSAPDGGSTQK